jgi:hypothetical protein
MGMSHVKSQPNLLLPLQCVRPSTKHYQAGVASLWPLATVEGAETHYICMK